MSNLHKNQENMSLHLNKCKKTIDELSPIGFGFLRSDLYARGIIRDLLLFEEHVPQGSSVLDIGCGLGYITSVLSAAGYFCIGIDLPFSVLDPDFKREKQRSDCWREFQKQHNSSYAYYGGKGIPLKNESFDAVIMHGVLEHVQNSLVAPFLADIQRILKDKGHIFLFRCPRKMALTETIAAMLRIPHHETLLTEEQITKMLEEHFIIESLDQTDLLPQHFPNHIQKAYNMLTPGLFPMQCRLDSSFLSFLSHHNRVVAVKNNGKL